MNDTEYNMSFDTLALVAGMVDALRHVARDKTVPKFYRDIASDALKKLDQK